MPRTTRQPTARQVAKRAAAKEAREAQQAALLATAPAWFKAGLAAGATIYNPTDPRSIHCPAKTT